MYANLLNPSLEKKSLLYFLRLFIQLVVSTSQKNKKKKHWAKLKTKQDYTNTCGTLKLKTKLYNGVAMTLKGVRFLSTAGVLHNLFGVFTVKGDLM